MNDKECYRLRDDLTKFADASGITPKDKANFEVLCKMSELIRNYQAATKWVDDQLKENNITKEE